MRKDTSVRESVHTALIICFLSGLLLLILGLGFSGILENNEHKRRTDRRRTALSESMLSRNVGFGGL